jgi:fatty acid desaturase
MCSFVAILHGLSHNHFFQSRKQTYIFGKIISSFVFMDFDNYRKQHLDHHASVEKK